MNLLEFERDVLALIEELNPDNENLTDDPDIAAKKRSVINHVMFELVRMKKIPKYIEFEVTEGEIIDYARIEKEGGYEVYQLSNIGGVKCDLKAQGTIIRVKESGTIEIDYFVFPERITEKTNAKGYEFELTPDVLEIMAYGVAADLLKSDVSTEYGSIYATRYESMKQQLDPRFNMGNISIEGGVYI